MKYYFENEDAEGCFTKEHFIDEMKHNGLTEMEVMEAVPQKSNETEYMWCNAIGEVGEKGNCGKMCENYLPRNGKSGICANQGRLFKAGEKVTLKLK